MAFFYRSGRSTAKSPLHLVAALTLAGCFGISTWSPFSKVMAANAATAVIWLSVDTSRLRIAVMRGDTELQLFENIAIGSNGPSKSRLMGDDTTPLGDFTITEIRHSERFELFMAFDYPNLEHTERALRISGSTNKNIDFCDMTLIAAIRPLRALVLEVTSGFMASEMAICRYMNPSTGPTAASP